MNKIYTCVHSFFPSDARFRPKNQPNPATLHPNLLEFLISSNLGAPQTLKKAIILFHLVNNSA